MSISWLGPKMVHFGHSPQHTYRHGYWLSPRVITSSGLSWSSVGMSLDAPLDCGLVVAYFPTCRSWSLGVWTLKVSPKVVILVGPYSRGLEVDMVSVFDII